MANQGTSTCGSDSIGIPFLAIRPLITIMAIKRRVVLGRLTAASIILNMKLLGKIYGARDAYCVGHNAGGGF